MSIFIRMNMNKILKRKLAHLDTSTKNSNITRKSEIIKNNSKKVLPSININSYKNKHKSILEQDSLVSSLLNNYKPNTYKKIEKSQSKIKSRNTIIIKSSSLNDLIIPKRKEYKFNSQRIFITEKNKNKINSINKNLLDKIKENIFEKDFNDDKKEKLLNIKKIKINNENEDKKTDKNINNIIPKKLHSERDLFINSNDKNIKISNKINTTTINNSSCNNISQISNNNYKRMRKFKNILLNEDKKIEKDNLNMKIQENIIINLYENNIKYQAKILEEQINLLNDCYKEYKLSYKDNNFIEIFNTKILESKIKYNKTIEETCSILYYLPQLFLKKWYNILFNSKKIPIEKKLISDYITDEILTLKNNNNLLSEIIFFFNKCFDVFLILSKKDNETTDLLLNQNIFLNIIKYIKIARYNLIYLNNSYINSKKKYLNDLIIIKNFLIRNNDINNNNKENISSFSKKIIENVLLVEKEKNKNMNIIEKIENQFLFKRNDEAQKIKRIENVLDIDKTKPICDHLGNNLIKKKRIFKSIFCNKHMNKILDYCHDDIKDQIITERISAEEEL